MNEHKDRFQELVEQAIDAIPEEYSEVHSEVVFRVDDVPSESQRQRAGLGPRGALFGLFEGVPRPGRFSSQSGLLPAVITVFKYPMVHVFPDETQLKEQIYETVWHEVAHYFGLNHDAIYKAKKSAGDMSDLA